VNVSLELLLYFSVTVPPFIDEKWRNLGMDRRVLVKGLFGIAGAGALAVIVPRQAEALVGFPSEDFASDNAFPELEKFSATPEGDAAPVLGDGVELASHRHRRRRRRRWRWRNYCRREYWYGHYRRRCHRRRISVWFWI
jgi:hypothetical protein